MDITFRGKIMSHITVLIRTASSIHASECLQMDVKSVQD